MKRTTYMAYFNSLTRKNLNLYKYQSNLNYSCLNSFSNTNLSKPVDELGFVYNDNLYCFSGEMYYYDINNNKWIQSEIDLPYSQNYGSAVEYNNKIHFLSAFDSMIHYSFDGEKFVEESTQPFDCSWGGACVYNGEIHIMRGGNHAKWNGSTWTPLRELPFTYSFSNINGAVVYQNKIHYCESSEHYAYDGSSWTSISTLPFIFTSASMVVYHDKLHLLGSRATNKGNEHYTWDGNKWTREFDLPVNYFEQGIAVVWNDAIHCLGGYGTNNDHLVISDGIIYQEQS